ncbi:hypothetical protein SAMN04488121_10155 [Chitinophaga filiformis]|uniref:Uncharacterized protein n=1 Tax=Chitinophaga filiformis TaxID=104663 RepID=A0A1G7GJZ3_CHIFI|nr:hypothetical protein SAMN04488121_10155 [Chitinophaga filiformis]
MLIRRLFDACSTVVVACLTGAVSGVHARAIVVSGYRPGLLYPGYPFPGCCIPLPYAVLYPVVVFRLPVPRLSYSVSYPGYPFHGCRIPCCIPVIRSPIVVSRCCIPCRIPVIRSRLSYSGCRIPIVVSRLSVPRVKTRGYKHGHSWWSAVSWRRLCGFSGVLAALLSFVSFSSACSLRLLCLFSPCSLRHILLQMRAFTFHLVPGRNIFDTPFPLLSVI